jgi:hypothetical protein
MTQWDFSRDTAPSRAALTSPSPVHCIVSLPRAPARRHVNRYRSALHLPPPSTEGPLPCYHPAPSRNEVAIVQPVLVKQLEHDILTAIALLPRWLLTSTKAGLVKMWIRPLPATSRKNGQLSRVATDAQDLDWASSSKYRDGFNAVDCRVENLMYQEIYHQL